MPDKIASKTHLFADDAKIYHQIEDKLDVTRKITVTRNLVWPKSFEKALKV